MHWDVHTLDLVQRGANLLPRHRRVTEEVDEFLDRLLEIDVVLPKRVVAIDQEKLASGWGCHPPQGYLGWNRTRRWLV